MDLFSLLSWAFSGALAGVLAVFIVGQSRERRAVYIIVTVALLMIFGALSRIFVLPRVYAWQADRELRKIAFYRELAESDPVLYQQVAAAALQGALHHEPQDAISARVAAILSGTLPSFLGHASDDSVNEYGKVMVGLLDDLRVTDADSCYFLLFPQQRPPGAASSHPLSKETQNKLLDSMAHIIHSSSHNPQPDPDPQESQIALTPVTQGLLAKYGNDLLLTQRPAVNSEERSKVCNISDDMFSQITALPPRDSSLVLRHLIAKGAQK